MNKQKGFTIIELIVVIAIIAVLAAIVMVNVTQYLNKGKDAAIQGNMASILTNAADYMNTHTDYTSICSVGTISAAMTAANVASGGTSTCTIKADKSAFCACSPLKNDQYNVFCVDSTGAKKVTSTGTSGTPITCTVACPAATGACDLTK
jgi:prepilin-type N-terminal cleavage/methylation domain-containing protein